MGNEGIGRRVKQSMGRERTQGAVAEVAGITPDAFSRAVRGARAFTSVEIARIADELRVDVYWLITGQQDPLRPVIAARHEYDHATGARAVPGRAEDEDVLQKVVLAYRQAYPAADRPSAELPSDAAGVRALLGVDFVRDFADGVEEHLDVDVIRVPGLSTAYSLTIGGRGVIILQANGNWFRSNWSLAHELAHLVLKHHEKCAESGREEAEANAFAAELLMPSGALAALDWKSAQSPQVADFLWRSGVSAEALRNRLDALGYQVGIEADDTLGLPTQRILRRGLAIGAAGGTDEITGRMDRAAARRFPRTLLDAHVRMIEEGHLSPGTLAWMLDTPENDLVIDRPDPPRASTEELASLLGL